MSGQLKSQSGVIRYGEFLEERLTAAAFGKGDLLIANANYRIKCTSDSVSWLSHGYSDSISYRPSAAELGKGTWQVGGVIYKSDGISYLSMDELSNQIAVKPFGFAVTVGSTSGAPDKTHLMKQAAPGDFMGVRLVIYNHSVSATTVYKSIVAPTDQHLNNSAVNMWVPQLNGVSQESLDAADGVGWRSVTWGGAASVTPAAGTADLPSITISDRVQISSIPRADGSIFPLLLSRTNVTVGETSFSGTVSTPTPDADNLGMIRVVGVIDDATGTYVTDTSLANYPNTASGTHGITIGYIFDTVKPGISLTMVGDSLTQNSTVVPTSTGIGHRVAATISALGIPCGYANCGFAAKNMIVFNAAASAHINAVPSNLVVMQGLSPNGPSSWSTVPIIKDSFRRQRGLIAYMTELVKNKRAKYIISTGIPFSDVLVTTAEGDAVRVAHNNDLKASGIDIVDFDAIVSDGLAPARIKAEYQYDKTHPNKVAVYLEADALISKVKAIYGI